MRAKTANINFYRRNFSEENRYFESDLGTYQTYKTCMTKNSYVGISFIFSVCLVFTKIMIIVRFINVDGARGDNDSLKIRICVALLNHGTIYHHGKCNNLHTTMGKRDSKTAGIRPNTCKGFKG